MISRRNAVFGIASAAGLVMRPAVLRAARTMLMADAAYSIDPSGAGNWTTFAAALDFIGNAADLCGKNVVVTVAVGSYPEQIALPDYIGASNKGHGQVTFVGASSDATLVKINPSSGAAILSQTRCGYTFRNMWLECPGGFGAEADDGGILGLDGVVFGPCSLQCVSLYDGSRIVFVYNPAGAQGYSIAGDAVCHRYSIAGGQIVNQPGTPSAPFTCKLIGTRAFASGGSPGPFILVNQGSLDNISATVFTGSFAGKKYTLDAASLLYTNGADPNTMIPGTINGP